jgi:hypothetical protein
MDFIFANSLKPNTVKKREYQRQRTSIVQRPNRIVSKVSCVYKTLRKVNKEEDPNVNMPINNIIKVAKPAIIKMIPSFAKILKIVIMKSPNVLYFPAPFLFGSRFKSTFLICQKHFQILPSLFFDIRNVNWFSRHFQFLRLLLQQEQQYE